MKIRINSQLRILPLTQYFDIHDTLNLTKRLIVKYDIFFLHKQNYLH